MLDSYKVVRDFESALCEYTGAKYAMTTTSCTMALLLAVAWHLSRRDPEHMKFWWHMRHFESQRSLYLPTVEIPKHTYISVPMSIIHAGGWPVFRDAEWSGAYRLVPFPIYDCARRFTRGMYLECNENFIVHPMLCVSFHWTKILAIGQGGAILHDNDEADEWFRREDLDADLLPQFASKGLQGRLAHGHLAARKFPAAGHVTAGRPLCHQHAARVVEQGPRGNVKFRLVFHRPNRPPGACLWVHVPAWRRAP